MTFQITTPELGFPVITDVSATQKVAPGTITYATDSVYGVGTFIYLKGVAGTAVGSVATYDTRLNTTTLAVLATRGPVAVAMAATVANTFGWYQIDGSAVVNSGTTTAGTVPYASATAGQLVSAVTAASKIDGMVATAANGTPAAGFAVVQMDRPSMNGNG